MIKTFGRTKNGKRIIDLPKLRKCPVNYGPPNKESYYGTEDGKPRINDQYMGD